MNLAAAHVGRLRVEQGGQSAEYAALGLAAQSQQYEIVARQDGVDQLRNHGIVIADDAGKNGLAGAELLNQVVAKLVFDFARTQALLGELALPQLAQGTRKIHSGAL